MPKRARTAATSRLLKDVHVAGMQIDAAPGGRLGWIIGFAREDPARWLPADREAHGYRLIAFGLTDWDDWSGDAEWTGDPWPEGVQYFGDPNRSEPERALTPKEILALHGELHEKFREIVNAPMGRGITFPEEGLKVALVRVTPPGAKPAVFRIFMSGPLRTMLWQKLLALVAETDRLIACPMCKDPFLALRKMKFCSPKCAQRWFDRKKIDARKNGGGGR